MFAVDLMNKNLITVQPGTTIADAARIMLDQHRSGLPVLDETGQLTGIVTEGDLLRRVEIGTADSHIHWLKAFLLPDTAAIDYVKTHGRRVGEVMTADPLTVTPQTSLAEVAKLLGGKRIKQLPVVDGGKLVGMIGRPDLLKALARTLIETTPCADTDAAITAKLNAALASQSWAPRNGIHATVVDKTCTLKGIIMSDAERRAVIVIAENTPGVRNVVDELVFVDPASGLAFQ